MLPVLDCHTHFICLQLLEKRQQKRADEYLKTSVLVCVPHLLRLPEQKSPTRLLRLCFFLKYCNEMSFYGFLAALSLLYVKKAFGKRRLLFLACTDNFGYILRTKKAEPQPCFFLIKVKKITLIQL